MPRSTNGIAPAPAGLYPTPKVTGNPFVDARAEWDSRTGLYVQWIKTLTVTVMLLGIAVLVLTGYAVMAPGKVQYLPYVVETSEVGQMRTVGILPHA
jgi:type IV secretory pathway TrbF-like protein